MRKLPFIFLLTFLATACTVSENTEKKAIKEEIEKAYLGLTSGLNDNGLNQLFYNPNIGMTFASVWTPLLLAGKTISTENIEVINFTDEETAEVKYDLVLKSPENEKRESITMTVKKVGGIWKLDADRFFPKKETQTGQTNTQEDFDAQIEAIKKQFNDGKITREEAIQKANVLYASKELTNSLNPEYEKKQRDKDKRMPWLAYGGLDEWLPWVVYKAPGNEWMETSPEFRVRVESFKAYFKSLDSTDEIYVNDNGIYNGDVLVLSFLNTPTGTGE